MFSRLSLTKRVVLLVAVPLVFELGFIGVLAGVLGQVEQERRAEAHARDLSAQLNTFLRMSMEGLVASILFYFSHEDAVWQRSETLSARLNEQMELISGTVADYPEEKRMIDRMKELAKEMETHGRKARDFLKDHDRSNALDEYAAIKSMFKEINELANGIVDEQSEVEKQKGIRGEMYRKRLQALLWVGIVLNSAVAFGMVMAFNRSLLSRLRVLSDNTMRVAAGKPLQPPVQGSDEIAHLDQFFHRMVQALEQAREKEKEIEQLKRDFVAMVSHDLRTPLTSIQMFHSALLEGIYGDLSGRGRDNLQLVESEVERLINLVNDLLNIEKLESGKMELDLQPVDVNIMLKCSADAVLHLAQAKDVRLNLNAMPAATIRAMDKERLVQVMINLLGNAIKFAEPDSAIDIAASPADDGQAVEISVSDRNRAIPEDLRVSIFERF